MFNKSMFYNPCFTNPVQSIFYIPVQSMFYKSIFYKSMFLYKSSPVHVLQIHVLQIHVFYKSSPCFTNPIQSMFYNMPSSLARQNAYTAKRIPFFVVLCDNFSPFSISKDQGSGTLSCMSAFRLLWYSRPQRRPIRLRVNQHSMRNDNCTSKNCFTNNS